MQLKLINKQYTHSFANLLYLYIYMCIVFGIHSSIKGTQMFHICENKFLTCVMYIYHLSWCELKVDGCGFNSKCKWVSSILEWIINVYVSNCTLYPGVNHNCKCVCVFAMSTLYPGVYHKCKCVPSISNVNMYPLYWSQS